MVDNFTVALKFQSEGLPKTVGEIGKITTAVNNIRKQNEEAAKTARILAEAYGLSESEVRQVEAAVESLQRQTAGVSNEARGLNGVLQGILQGIGQGVFGAISSSFQAATHGLQTLLASTLEVGQAARSAEDAFTTFLGSSEEAQATLQELSDFAAQTPFDLPGVRNAGQQLLAFGFQTDELTDQLSRVGNIAAGVQTDFNELAAIYGKARTQGRLFAEDINQLTERGIPIIGELAAQFGVTESEVRGLVESGQVGFEALEQAFISLTSEGGKFFNLLQTQSGTVVGQISNLGDSFVQLQEQIFRAFEPAIAEGLQLISITLEEVAANSNALDILADGGDRLQEALAANPELAEELGRALAEAADAGAQLVADGLEGSATFLEENPDKISESVDLIFASAGAILDLVGIIGQLISLQAAIGNFLSELFQIDALIGIVAGVIDRLAVLGEALGFIAEQVQRVASLIDNEQDADAFTPAINGLNDLRDSANSVQSAYESIRDSQQQAQTQTANLTQSVVAQGKAYEEATRALGLQEQQRKAALLSQGAGQDELLALEDNFLQQRIQLNEQRLAELTNIQNESGVTPEQRAAAEEEALKLEETIAKQKVEVAQNTAHRITEINKQRRDAAIKAAKEETEALKRERDEQERIATEAFNTQQRQQSDSFDEQERLASTQFDTQQRVAEERFNDQQRNEKQRFEDDLRASSASFEDSQRNEQRQFEDSQQSAQKQFNDQQRSAEQAFQNKINAERQQGNAEFDALDQEVDNRVALIQASSREERKAIKERIEAEKEAAEIRRDVEADVLRDRNSVLADADTDLSPLEQARADFEADLQAKEAEFQQQQQLAAEEFETNQRAADQDFEDGQRLAKQTFDEEQRQAELTFQDGQRQTEAEFQDQQRLAQSIFEDDQRALQSAFEDAQRLAEAAFKDNQRTLDENSATEIKRILDSANAVGGVEARREGGAVKPGQPYLVGEDGPELIFPSRSGYVATAGQTAKILGSARSFSLPEIAGGDLSSVEKKLDQLIKVAQGNSRPRISAGGNTYNISSQADPTVTAQKLMLDQIRSLARGV